MVLARSQMDMTAKIIYSNLKATRSPDGMSWMTETGEAEHGLQLACTLVPDLLTDVPVRVMNVLNYPVTWARRSVVGTLEPVKVVTAREKETGPEADMSFKTDLMAAVDGELQPEAK